MSLLVLVYIFLPPLDFVSNTQLTSVSSRRFLQSPLSPMIRLRLRVPTPLSRNEVQRRRLKLVSLPLPPFDYDLRSYDATRCPTDTSLSSPLRTVFDRRPSLGNGLATASSSNTSLDGSIINKSRSSYFSSLFKRRAGASPSPSPSPSPSIDAFDFEDNTESLFEEAKKNR